MSRIGLIESVYDALAEMTVLNGYSFNYLSYKMDMSVDNGTLLKTVAPKISVSFRPENPIPEALTDGSSGYMHSGSIPAVVQCRFHIGNEKLDELEYEREIMRAKIIDDIAKRFSLPNPFDCVYEVEFGGEEEPDFSMESEDKYGNYVFMVYNMKYRTEY